MASHTLAAAALRCAWNSPWYFVYKFTTLLAESSGNRPRTTPAIHDLVLARRRVVRIGHLTWLLLYVATVPTGTADEIHGTSRMGEVLTQGAFLR